MPSAALLIISQVRVKNLPACGVRDTDLVRVKFRCGSGAVETSPLNPDHDGTAEWTTTLEMPLPDADMHLVAVVSRKRASGNWSLIPGGRFEGPVVSTLRSLTVWREPSIAGIEFFSTLETVMQEEEVVQQPGITPQGMVRMEDGRPPPSVPLSSEPLDDANLEYTYLPYDGEASESSAGYADAWSGDSDQPADGQDIGGSRHTPSAGVPTESATAHHAVATYNIIFGAAAPVSHEQGHRAGSAHGALMAPSAAPPIARARSAGGFPLPSSGYLVRGDSHDGDIALRRGSSRWSSRSSRSGRSSFRSDEALDDVQRVRESSPRFPPPEGVLEKSSLLDPDATLKEEHEEDGYASPVGRLSRSRLLDDNHRLDEKRPRDQLVWGGAAFAKESAPAATLEQAEDEQREEVKAEGTRRVELSYPGASLAPPAPASSSGKKEKTFFGNFWRANRKSSDRKKSVEVRSGKKKPQREITTTSMSPHDDVRIVTGTSGLQRHMEMHTRFKQDKHAHVREPPSGPTNRRHSTIRSASRRSFKPSQVSKPDARDDDTSRLDAPPAHEVTPKIEAPLHTDADWKARPPGAPPSVVSTSVGQASISTRGGIKRAESDPHSRRLVEPPSREKRVIKLLETRASSSLRRRAFPETIEPPPSSPLQPPSGSMLTGGSPPPTAPQQTEAEVMRPARRLASATVLPLHHSRRLLGLSSSVGEEDGDWSAIEEGRGSSYALGDALGLTWLGSVAPGAPEQSAPDGWIGLLGQTVSSAEMLHGGEKGAKLRLPMPLPPELSSGGLGEPEYSVMPQDSLGTIEVQQPRSMSETRPCELESQADVRKSKGPRPGPLTPTPSTVFSVIEGPHDVQTRAVRPGPGSELASLRRQAHTAPSPLPRSWNSAAGLAGADPVCFSCFSPAAVSEGMAFVLRVSAYLRQQRGDVLHEAKSIGVAEAGVPGAMPIMRGARVTVKLDLPNDVFEVMQRGNQESAGAVRHASPSVQEFEWTGQEAKADFKVGVRRGATLGSVLCGAQIIEGSTVTRLSFCVEVVESGRGIAGLWGAEVQELETNMEPVQTDVARIDHEELEIKDKLGEGIQGVTYSGQWRGKAVAVKQLKEAPTSVPGTRGRSDIEHEATILSLLGSHPNIVEFHGLSRSNSGTFSVVTKLETGGSLEDVLRRNSRDGREPPNGNGRSVGVGSESKCPGRVRTTWARDLAHGLASSHTFGVVHNDVACRNALLSVNGSTGRALLCDFGLSSSLRGGGTGLEAARLVDLGDGKRWPLKQMPKEALQAPFALSPLSDSYMFGMTLYELYSGQKPFAGVSTKQAVQLVLEGRPLDPPELLERQGPTLLKVFNNCLSPDLSIRPSMKQVVDMLSANGDGSSTNFW